MKETGRDQTWNVYVMQTEDEIEKCMIVGQGIMWDMTTLVNIRKQWQCEIKVSVW